MYHQLDKFNTTRGGRPVYMIETLLKQKKRMNKNAD